MTKEILVPYTLDDYFSTTSIGSVDNAIGNNLYGINHRQTPGRVPPNKDTYGLTFFTRPQLNLQADNIRTERRFYSLLSKNELSMQRYIRCMLDPRLNVGVEVKNISSKVTDGKIVYTYPAVTTPLIDNHQAFIPVLTNNLLTLSGWPDVTAPVFESDAGMYKESYAQVDGLTKNYESFDLDASFRNTTGDPILYMFYVWLHYMGNVFEGRMVPYMDYLVENVIDYNTRIYRLVLDIGKDKVKKIAATGASFPVSVPTGSFFDFNSETPYSDQNKDISIRFRCLGAEYLDDILIREFNETTYIFHSHMRDGVREKKMTKIDKKYLPLFNNRGYPHINENNYNLEWWVDNSLYSNIMKTTHPDLSKFYPDAADNSSANRQTGIDQPQTKEQETKVRDMTADEIRRANDGEGN
jgi:hypothetical protein